MDVTAVFEAMPYNDLLGIEVTSAADGHAEGRLDFDEELLSSPIGSVAHGGATYSLADTVGGAAVISLTEAVAPTVDMRIDYLAPTTRDLTAIAEVLRAGESVAVAAVEVSDADRQVASARGVYKTGGHGSATAWTDGAGDGPS